MADEPINGNFGMAYVVKELRHDVDTLQQTVVPRKEHELLWKNNDERNAFMRKTIEEVSHKVDTLLEGDIPRRLDRVEKTLEELPSKILKSTSIIVSIISTVVAAIVWLIAHVGH